MEDGPRARRRDRCGRSRAEQDHLEPFATSFDHVVVPGKDAHHDPSHRPFKGRRELAADWGAAVTHRVVFGNRCEDLSDGSAMRFHANAIRGPLHMNFGARATTVKRGEKQWCNRQRDQAAASHRALPQV
jgi:hypothetical protein